MHLGRTIFLKNIACFGVQLPDGDGAPHPHGFGSGSANFLQRE